MASSGPDYYYDENVLAQHFLAEDRHRQKYKTIRDHPIFQDPTKRRPIDKLLPTATDALDLEPLLKKPFALFSGQIKLTLDAASDVVSQEMYKYLKVQLQKERDALEVTKSENMGREILLK